MRIFDAPDYDNHKQVSFFSDHEVGLKAVIAIHDLTLGPALGGCRMWDYQSEEDALKDVLRLSKGMTYKAALAGVELGGGKSVVMGDPNQLKSPKLMHAMGRIINSFNGDYITGPDIGTGVADMTEIFKISRYVIGVAEEKGGMGDPSPSTARGVFQSIRAGLNHKFGSPDLSGIRVAVQGLGHVGFNLCRFLHQEGATLVVTDIDENKMAIAEQKFNAEKVSAHDIYEIEADVYAPCAFGAVINDETLEKFKVKIIAGAANNQLAESKHGLACKQLGITYLPDYISNGGGLIRVAVEWYKEGEEQLEERVEGIYDTCRDILNRADREDIPTNIAADRIADDRLAKKKTSLVS